MVCIISLIFLFFITSYTEAEENTPVYTLEECLESACTQCKDILIANIGIANDRLQLKRIKAENSFKLNFSGSYSHLQAFDMFDPVLQSMSGNALIDNVVQTAFTFSLPETGITLSGDYVDPFGHQDNHFTNLELSLHQVIWDGYSGFRSKGIINQAELNLRIRELYYTKMMNELIFRVKQAYFNLINAQRTYNLRKEIYNKRQEELKRTSTYFAVQKVIDLDVEQAEINTDLAKVDLAYAENNLKISRMRLSSITRLPSENNYYVKETESPPLPDIDESNAIHTAFRHRIELQELFLNRQIAKTEYNLNKSLKSPVVAVSTGIDWDKEWVNDRNSNDWRFEISLDWPLLDSGLADTVITSIKNQLDIYRLQEERYRETITAEVSSALFSVIDSFERISIAQRILAQTKGRYELAEKKYQKGLINRFDVMDTELTYSNALVDVVKSETDYQLSILNYYNALGLSDSENLPSLLPDTIQDE
ncbi:MAG: TolC family protein [Spirochaetales bacterium]|nr:TolC family protein [Spirochaetales bacterium]